MKYSFVLILTSLTRLATTVVLQKNFCFKMRAVGLATIKTKECSPFIKVVHKVMPLQKH